MKRTKICFWGTFEEKQNNLSALFPPSFPSFWHLFSFPLSLVFPFPFCPCFFCLQYILWCFLSVSAFFFYFSLFFEKKSFFFCCCWKSCYLCIRFRVVRGVSSLTDWYRSSTRSYCSRLAPLGSPPFFLGRCSLCFVHSCSLGFSKQPSMIPAIPCPCFPLGLVFWPYRYDCGWRWRLSDFIWASWWGYMFIFTM